MCSGIAHHKTAITSIIQQVFFTLFSGYIFIIPALKILKEYKIDFIIEYQHSQSEK